MGISGLLLVLKSITETKELSAYRGQTLAIDGYCWCVGPFAGIVANRATHCMLSQAAPGHLQLQPGDLLGPGDRQVRALLCAV